MSYSANKNRYQNMQYRNCGSSGLKLPLLSVGLWHNFGGIRGMSSESKKILFTSFDAGITHFDLANNYGPPYGSAEANFGKVMQSDFKKYRDEMIISSKAGYDMWDGPYGEWGSRKYILASLDQSLKRMGVEYFDLFFLNHPHNRVHQIIGKPKLVVYIYRFFNNSSIFQGEHSRIFIGLF